MKRLQRILVMLAMCGPLALLFFPQISEGATTVDLTVGGNSGPITTTVGTPVVFDVNVNCGTSPSGGLIYVPGTAQPKGGDRESEVAWDIQNQTASTIRIVSFGVGWNCLNDPGNICSNWFFDYVKFDTPPVSGARKIFDSARSSNPFPLTNFDRNVGTGSYAHPYIDILPGATVPISEIEFVDSRGEKFENIPSGTSVEFTVTWGDANGNTYVQTFSVTW